jgi:hypothetical protein
MPSAPHEPKTPREALLMILTLVGTRPIVPTMRQVSELCDKGLAPRDLSTFQDYDRTMQYLADSQEALRRIEEAMERGDIEPKSVELLRLVQGARVLPPDLESSVEIRRHRSGT